MSFMTPILMTPSEICAAAGPAAHASAAAAADAAHLNLLLVMSTLLEVMKENVLSARAPQTPRYSCSMSIFGASSAAARLSTMRPCSMT